MTRTPIDIKDYTAMAPGVVSGMRALEKGAEAAHLDQAMLELVKIRVSQINGCAYCLQYHVNVARQLRVPAAKLDLVAVWHEAELYDARERAALGWAEALTRMAGHDVPDAAHDALKAHFSTGEIAHLTAAIAHINAWNRIAGGLRFAPPAARGGA